MNNNKIIPIEDLENARLKNTEPNDCNVLTDYYTIVISDSKKLHFCLTVARYNNLYHFGFYYDYGTGGGCSSPHTNSRLYENLKSGAADMLARLLSISNYSRYHQDMISALNKLKQPNKPIQLTLDLF